jgi:protein-S-isoprenylcysteine O-methyltransferase Ste14
MTLHQPLFELSSVWRRVFWSSWAAWVLTELWVFSRDRRAASDETRTVGSHALRVGLIFLGAYLAFFLAWRSGAWRIGGPPALVFWAGIVLVLTGVGLRIWAALTLKRVLRTVVTPQDGHPLVTSGPYRMLRNPAYAGTLLTLLGLGVALGSWPSVLVAGGGALLGCCVRIPVEERALQARFGEAYALWAERTWALIPMIW